MSLVTVTPGEAAVDRLLTNAPIFPLQPGGAEGEHDFTHLPFFRRLRWQIESSRLSALRLSGRANQQAAQNKDGGRCFPSSCEHTSVPRPAAGPTIAFVSEQTDVAGIGFRVPTAGAQPQVVAGSWMPLPNRRVFGFRPPRTASAHARWPIWARGRAAAPASAPRHERLQRFRDSVVHTSLVWVDRRNWEIFLQRLPALLSMPVSLGDASTV